MTTSADLVRLAEVPETVYGTTPATPVFKVIRASGESLAFAPTTTQSQNMNPARQVGDSILTGGSVAGAISFELAKEVWFEDLLAGALCNDWAANVLTIGTKLKSFTIEKTIPITPDGLTNDYHRIPGAIMNGFSLTVAPNAPVTANFDILGKDQITAAAIVTGATYGALAMDPVFTAPLVTNITITGVAAGTPCFNNITLTLNNNDRALECIGTLGAREMALGRAEVTVAFSLYYFDKALLDMLKAQTSFAMSFKLVDNDTPPNSYQFDLPKCKLTQCNVVAGGTGQDVVADCVATSLLDTVTGTSLKITRAPGPATVVVEEGTDGETEGAAREEGEGGEMPIGEPGQPEPVPASLLTSEGA
jgi:hypothetical protein